MTDGYPVCDCLRCGHRYAGQRTRKDHVAAVYGDAYFSGGGAGYPDYLGEAELLIRHGERCARIVAPHAHGPGRVLDVGAAAGFILKGFANEGWEGVGVEPNAAMAAHGREVLGLDVRTGTLESSAIMGMFDLVSFVQVVAHFRDPLAAFRRADAMTLPGGLWLVETWDCSSMTARLLGRAWHEYSPPSVLHWWTPRLLGETLGSLGYRQLATGTPHKWLGAGHAKSLLRHKLGALPWFANALPDSLALPYPSEDLFWAVYRKE